MLGDGVLQGYTIQLHLQSGDIYSTVMQCFYGNILTPGAC